MNLSIAFSLPDAAAGALDLGFEIVTFRTFSLFLVFSFSRFLIFSFSLSEAKIVERHLLDVVEDVDDDEEEDD